MEAQESPYRDDTALMAATRKIGELEVELERRTKRAQGLCVFFATLGFAIGFAPRVQRPLPQEHPMLVGVLGIDGRNSPCGDIAAVEFIMKPFMPTSDPQSSVVQWGRLVCMERRTVLPRGGTICRATCWPNNGFWSYLNAHRDSSVGIHRVEP